MPIYKIQKRENPFVQIDKQIFDNPHISWKAKGLLGYLLSKPDDWQVLIADIINKAKDGETACRTALAELEEHGHLAKKRERAEDGSFSKLIYFVFEHPKRKGDTSTPGTSNHNKKTPRSGHLYLARGRTGSDLSTTGEPPTTNKNIYTNKENTKMESSSTNNEPSLIEQIEEVISYWNATFEEEVDLTDMVLMKNIEKAVKSFSVPQLIEAMEGRSHATYYKKEKPEYRDDPTCFFPHFKTIRRDMKRPPAQKPYDLITYEKKVELEAAVSGGRNVNVEEGRKGSIRFEMDPVKKDAKGRPMWRYYKNG